MTKESGKRHGKIIGFSLIVALVVIGYFFIQSNPGNAIQNIFAPRKIRVMIYNIHHGVGMDGEYDISRIVSVIRKQEPHFVCLNEVDYKTRRTNGDEQARMIAAELGMNFTFARNIELQGGFYGNAILTKFPIEFAENKLLYNRLNSEQRGLLHIFTHIGGRRVHVYTTHLSTDSTESGKQVKEILNIILEWAIEDPVILAGDFNLQPKSSKIYELTYYFADYGMSLAESGWSYPSDEPEKKIDYIFYNSMFSVKSYGVIKDEQAVIASDHLPIVGIYDFKD
ncbi:MAG: hypothetical protein COT43_03490 [Candidatus Marinimicrobia bacterium CG08_land_8_20_14_0_20_45_22]|nr:MAG: hypothetical protein COT43_03490 [Candidatus Marinimicrobia bacterium CG08_land_8_20_14_0_20_45_22]